MRFLADENVSRRVVERLRADGYDVMSIGEATEDRDFGELVIRQRLEVQGVILLELDRLSNAEEAASVAEVVSAHVDKLSGNLVVVEPGRTRVRPLPRAQSKG